MPEVMMRFYFPTCQPLGGMTTAPWLYPNGSVTAGNVLAWMKKEVAHGAQR
jgi:hypothetical protein